MRIPLFHALAVCLAFALTARAAERISVAYSFVHQEGGGIASAEIEPHSGRIIAQDILLRDLKCTAPGKIRRSNDGQHLAVTNLTKEGPHVFFLGADRSIHAHQLPAIPDEMRFAPQQLLVSCEEDALAVITWQPSHELRLLKMDKLLSPPANGPEDVQIVPHESLAVITCQKDGKGGKKKGHRVVVLDLLQLKFVGDVHLPRDHPELHMDQNNKESGPSPEVIFVSPKSDTLVVTLDLYGAVGMMRWSAAQQGRLEDWAALSTSPRRTWGTAFPDRGTTLQFGDRDYLLVHNAGEEGGSCVIDLQKRRIAWQRPTPPGLEQSVYFPQLRRAFSVCSGKVKKRKANDVVKETEPRTGIYHFDFRSQQTVRNAAVEHYPLEWFASRIHAVSMSPPLLLIAAGRTANQPDMLMTFDPVTMEVRDRQPARGMISQFER